MTVAAGIAVSALGVWGLLIDEPYWRAVGHGPSAFTWATWAAIVLSGPAWLAARLAAWALVSQLEIRFILEHVLWAGLAAAQWSVVFRSAAAVRPAWPGALGAAGVSGGGGMLALTSWRARWPLVHGESDHWGLVDWPLGLFGLALLPAVWLCLQHWYHRGRPHVARQRPGASHGNGRASGSARG